MKIIIYGLMKKENINGIKKKTNLLGNHIIIKTNEF